MPCQLKFLKSDRLDTSVWPGCVSAEWLGDWRPLPTAARICVTLLSQSVSGAHPALGAVDFFPPGSGQPHGQLYFVSPLFVHLLVLDAKISRLPV